MSLIVTTEFELQRIAPPALPQAREEYDRIYQDQLNNVLRLYFNRLQNILGQLETAGGIIPATTNYTVATLPSAVTSGSGARAFVSDANATTFASTVAGGGANKVPVYSDGTNWKIG
jgi:hypothetical protein